MLSGSQSSPTIGVRSCSLEVQQDQPLLACARALIEKASGAGHIKLWLPVFHIGYWKSMLSTLQCICKSCSSILLPEEEFKTYLRRMRSVCFPLSVVLV